MKGLSISMYVITLLEILSAEDNPADMLTKTLPAGKFKKCLNIIGAKGPCPFEAVLTKPKMEIFRVDFVNSLF